MATEESLEAIAEEYGITQIEMEETPSSDIDEDFIPALREGVYTVELDDESVVMVEKQLSGWYAQLRKAKDPERLEWAYRRLAATVRERAGFACDYCRLPEALHPGPFEVELFVRRERYHPRRERIAPFEQPIPQHRRRQSRSQRWRHLRHHGDADQQHRQR